jgi:glycerol kinase
MTTTKKYILSIDQSTSATKTILFDKKGKLVDRVTIPHKQFYPKSGFVEHDPIEVFNNCLEGIHKIIHSSKIVVDEISGIAITNQRETALIWEKQTGKPVANAAVWQCQRGAGYCQKLKDDGYSNMISEKTGLIIDPYFSASKLHWIMSENPGLKEKAIKGELLLGTMDSWILWNLTDKKVHATDYSNACRTLLFNINSLDWDQELIELFGLDRSMFPEVKFSDEIFGFTEPGIVFETPIPIAGLMGDSHAALFGQNCFTPGMGKATFGTGSSIMVNIGEKPLSPPEGLVLSIGYGVDSKIHYVFEGNIHCTGDTINWLKNELQLIDTPSETEKLAELAKDNNGIYFVPAFTGLGAPHWDNDARACISGISRNSRKEHIVRAALESIAFQIKDLISLIEGKSVIKLEELRVDGGPTKNNFLMQFQSDILGHKVNRSEIEEVSALGSSFMAGLATHFWKDLEEISSLRENSFVYQPKLESNKVTELYDQWKMAVKRARLY